MVARFLVLAISILLFSSAAIAQSTRPAIRPTEPRTADRYPDDEQDPSRLPDDMRIKMAIARAEENHKKFIDDVEKLSDLSDEVARGYGERKRLTSDDVKKLGNIEKLAKRILSHAGGDEVDPPQDSLDQMVVADAIEALNTTASKIRKEMTGETRFVVSATVIANSNEVINLSRFIRRAKKAD
jgi:hypothetical protein